MSNNSLMLDMREDTVQNVCRNVLSKKRKAGDIDQFTGSSRVPRVTSLGGILPNGREGGREEGREEGKREGRNNKRGR